MRIKRFNEGKIPQVSSTGKQTFFAVVSIESYDHPVKRVFCGDLDDFELCGYDTVDDITNNRTMEEPNIFHDKKEANAHIRRLTAEYRKYGGIKFKLIEV